MGENDTTPISFFMKTGKSEYSPIPTHIPELTLTESEETEVSNMRGCKFCKHSDQNRRKDNKIRCKRFSCWVKPLCEVCEEYTEEYQFNMSVTPEVKELFAGRSRRP